MKTKGVFILQNKSVPFFLMLMFLSSGFSIAQDQFRLISGEKDTIKSLILNEEREISVYLPEDYMISSQEYPVIYLLDGRTHFHHVTGAVDYLSDAGITPKMIVVSIHNVDRNRDFSPIAVETIPTSGGADKFLQFLKDELDPYIDKKFRTSDFSILIGHSFGGTFVAYTLLTQPNLIDGYIAISPYLQYADNFLVNKSKELLKSNYQHPKYFYMSVGDEPNYFPALDEFSTIVRQQSKEAITLSYEKMKDEDHGSIPYLSVYKGLRFIFSDWQLPPEAMNKGLEEIDHHYRTVSKKYGYEINTPENIINRLGYTYLQKQDISKAIEVFSENVKRFPNSGNVYDSLGEAYENNNQLELAEQNYMKAWELGKMNNDRNTPVYKKNLDRMRNRN